MPRKRPADGSGSDPGSSKTGRKSSGNCKPKNQSDGDGSYQCDSFYIRHKLEHYPRDRQVEGTVRTFNPKVREQIVELMQAQAEGLEREGYQVEFTWIPGCPATNNDAETGRTCAKRSNGRRIPCNLAASGDGGRRFFLLSGVGSGSIFHVGTGGKYPAHNSKFTVDPAATFWELPN